VIVLAELFPRGVNELFDWPAFFAKDTIVAFNKTALMALVSTAICIGIHLLSGAQAPLVPSASRTSPRRATGVRVRTYPSR